MQIRPKNGSVFECIFCTFVGRCAQSLRKHFSEEHYRNLLFWCKYCGKAWDCLDDFFKHLEEDECKEVFMHPCGFQGCDYTSAIPLSFIAHLKNGHKGKHFMPCKYCKRIFTMHSCLIIHIQSECCQRPKSNLAVNLDVLQTPSADNCQNATIQVPNPSNSHSLERRDRDLTSNIRPSDLLHSKTKVSSKKKTTHKNKQKKKENRIFETEHSDSDAEDPTWNPLKDDETRKEKPKVYSRKIELIQKEFVPEYPLKRQKTITPPADEDSETRYKRYGTWEDWWQEFSVGKSSAAVCELLSTAKVEGFFKCMEMHCSFSSNSDIDFLSHITVSNHNRKCLYCFSCFSAAELLVKHMVATHGNRRWQCTVCLYRSSRKSYAKCHRKTAHEIDAKPTFINCEQVETEGNHQQGSHANGDIATRNSYRCGMPGCEFTTLITTFFQTHLLVEHSDCERYWCAYCTDYIQDATLHTFVSHSKEHDIHEFECSHCLFGSDKSNIVLMHMAINHPDFKINILSRQSIEEIANLTKSQK